MKGIDSFMILIIDEDRAKRAFALKERLENGGIPTVVTNIDGIRNYPVFLLAVVFADSEEYLNLASVRLGKCHLVAVNCSGSRIYNHDVVFCDGDEAGFIIKYIKETLNTDPDDLVSGELRFTKDSVRAGLVYMTFTATEKRILRLFMFLKGRWVDERTVLKACFVDSGRRRSDKTSVHICNINKKGRTFTGKPFILCKRGLGYTLNLNI